MSRIEAYLAAAADAKAAHETLRGPAGHEAVNAALNAVGQAYLNLTRGDCAQLWPGSPESQDPKRRP